jgi:serine protease
MPSAVPCLAAAALLLVAVVADAATRMPAAGVDRSAAGLIVQLKPGAPSTRPEAADADAGREKLLRVLRDAGLHATPRRPVGGAHLVDFGRRLAAADAERMAAVLRARPDVAWVVPNERERLLQAVDDPMFSASASSTGQWWPFPAGGSDANAIGDRLRGVPDIQSAWTIQTGSPSAVVAVLDTGITPHPDLEGHLLPGWDFVSDPRVANDGGGRDADPTDTGDWVSATDQADAVFRDCGVQNSSWHGTVIAGMLAAVANNTAGVAGISWDGRVLPVRVGGKCGADVADLVDGMRWAAGLRVAGVPINRHPARIINISFGGDAACNAAYQSAIDEVRARGAVVVAAAGNERAGPTRPANCEGVVGVTALNRDGFKATYANFGPQLTVATVGGDPQGDGRWGQLLGDDGLLTLDNDGLRGPGSATYAHVYGTSFAAPIAAGVLSLMLSVNPDLTADQLVQGLRATARPHVVSSKMDTCSPATSGRCICTTATCGAGILDAGQALRYAIDPASYVAPVWPVTSLDSPEIDAAVVLGRDAAPGEVPQQSSPPADDGGGGGLVHAVWLLALAAAVAALRRAR